MEGQIWWADKFSLKNLLFFSFTSVICKDKGLNEFCGFGINGEKVKTVKIRLDGRLLPGHLCDKQVFVDV